MSFAFLANSLVPVEEAVGFYRPKMPVTVSRSGVKGAYALKIAVFAGNFVIVLAGAYLYPSLHYGIEGLDCGALRERLCVPHLITACEIPRNSTVL